MNTQHTPTLYVNPSGFIVTSTGEVVTRLDCCQSDKQEMAAFIVRCCNSHAQLVAALEGVAQKLTELLEGRTMDSTLPDFYVVRNARNQARAALTAAKE